MMRYISLISTKLLYKILVEEPSSSLQFRMVLIFWGKKLDIFRINKMQLILRMSLKVWAGFANTDVSYVKVYNVCGLVFNLFLPDIPFWSPLKKALVLNCFQGGSKLNIKKICVYDLILLSTTFF